VTPEVLTSDMIYWYSLLLHGTDHPLMHAISAMLRNHELEDVRHEINRERHHPLEQDRWTVRRDAVQA
jgi:hypothetical protein